MGAQSTVLSVKKKAAVVAFGRHTRVISLVLRSS
jgi:hypothetical protein